MIKRRKRRGERYIDRWLKSHRRVTSYLSKEEYEFIKRIAESKGLGIKDLFLEVLKDLIDFKNEVEKSYWEGYYRAREDYCIWYYCDACGRRIVIYPDSEEHKDIMEYMRRNWVHRGMRHVKMLKMKMLRESNVGVS
jgi:hypothetical protein